MQVNDDIIENKTDIGNELNSFYCDVNTMLINKIQQLNLGDFNEERNKLPYTKNQNNKNMFISIN